MAIYGDWKELSLSPSWSQRKRRRANRLRLQRVSRVSQEVDSD